MRAFGLLLIVLATAVCEGTGGVNGPTPGFGPGPALEMSVLGVVACPSDMVATTCVQVRVTNRGTNGDGSCTLWASIPGPDGDESVAGPRIAVIDLASGASTTEILAWTKARPAAEYSFFQGLCDPGLLS
jgi:hypothetical protein